MDKKEVLEVLGHVYDPDYQDRSVVDMGLVGEDDIHIEGGAVKVNYRLTAPLCPFSAAIGLMVKYALEQKLGVQVSVQLDPSHGQGGLVKEILESQEKSQALLQKLKDFGVLAQCVRFEEASP
ncbi:MAG: iron-sulfur cluster assembly protein [Dehalococcoidia bacterium]|nr:iron-sulfur cluster assembly protein [Dehalococcoidia bacterium]